MAFRAEWDSKDDVPEALRSHVVEDDGKFVLEGESKTDINGLKNALGHEKDEARKLKAALKKFDGLDADEIRQIIDEREKRQNDAARAKGDFEKLEAKLKGEHAKDIELRDKRVSTLEAALRSEKVDNAATQAIIELEGSPKVLLPHVTRDVRVIEDDTGTFHTVVVDEHGEPRLKKDAKTGKDYLSLEEHVSGFKDDPEFAGAFKGSGASGSGSRPGFPRAGKTATDAKAAAAEKGAVIL
jgi:hypothetical protein